MLGDVATTVGVGVAVVLGVAGLLDAKRSRRLAQQANDRAETANRIAADAARQAVAANSLADHANQLSEDANAVAKRTAALEEEDWFVEWTVEWDGQLDVLTLYQRGRDDALEPSVVVAADHLHRVYRIEDDVHAGGEVTLAFHEIREPRIQHARQVDAVMREARAGGAYVIPSAFTPDARIVIRWKTGLGVPQQQVIQQQLS